VRNGNSRVVNGYEVPTNPNRVVFSKNPISPTDTAARAMTLRRFMAGESVYALANMNAKLDPQQTWMVMLFVDDEQKVKEYLDERSQQNAAERVVPLEIAPATAQSAKNAYISYKMVEALNNLSPGLHKVWVIIGVSKSAIEQPYVAEGIFYLDTQGGSGKYSAQLSALRQAAAPEFARQKEAEEKAAREARESRGRQSSSGGSDSSAQQPGMPPPGFDPNIRFRNACDQARTIYFGNGEQPTLNGNSSMEKRLKPGTKIYLLDDQGNKTEIYTVGEREDQEVRVCGKLAAPCPTLLCADEP
jgi:hypothetical protein